MEKSLTKKCSFLVIALMLLLCMVFFGASQAYADSEPSWGLEAYSVEYECDSEEYIPFTGTGYESLSVTSSNESVADAYIDEEYLTINTSNKVGTAVITLTDGTYTKTVNVKVLAPPLELDTENVTLDTYRDYSVSDDEGFFYIYTDDECENVIKNATSSNTKVVKVSLDKDDPDNICVDAQAVGVGSANITVIDNYNQKVVVPVTVTQKYMDELRYIDELEMTEFCNANDNPLKYGDSKVLCYCDLKGAVISTTINNKKYVAKYNSTNENYVITGLPRVNAGKKITFTIQKGKAVFKRAVTIRTKSGKGATVTIKTQTYTGKALKPAVVVKDGSRKLVNGTDYTVKYANNKNVGKATVTVTFKGNYKDSKKGAFVINPKGTTLKSLTAKKRALVVKWNKQATKMSTSVITGYQIQLATNKTFTKNVKNVTVKGYKAVSKKVTGLKRKATYYVRVRTYKVVSGKTYYSPWSAVKYKKTK